MFLLKSRAFQADSVTVWQNKLGMRYRTAVALARRQRFILIVILDKDIFISTGKNPIKQRNARKLSLQN
ncbi:hypothetical protein GOY13_01625 [Wolbachia endosymbiont of Cruorifilaria tuberocauda]|uniref:hypothetical protein n=1 Tax=Wolbachia endosymbiont of Cruorifilaria tuberocauda TaxID=1812111 RepID=UPI00158B8F2B|nr:hypothetical protein [Wolbachia endosymbiont of Cruorifilaria tuberocauda]QKX01637.1 hypothetical protein GOY13_01625 [Wolbachia endosymbiont of Cruorifilaria tuberocauda]